MTSRIAYCVAVAVICLGSLTSVASPRHLSRRAAVRDAKRDIASGHMKIFFAGTEFASERGMERRDIPFLRRVPRDYSLPMGCTDPQAEAAIEYATVYNRAIIEHLRRVQSH